ncbi:MAG: DUF4430 domain-containing protein [Eubacterium sp.]|nr:DUF4430 domain-containing protein [Eubacterium sp.]
MTTGSRLKTTIIVVWCILIGCLIYYGISGGSSSDSRFAGEETIVSVTGSSISTALPDDNSYLIRSSEAPADEENYTGSRNAAGEQLTDNTKKNGSSEYKTDATKKTSDEKNNNAGSDNKQNNTSKATPASVHDSSSTGAGDGSNNSDLSDVRETKSPKPAPDATFSPTKEPADKKDIYYFTIECKKITDRPDLWRDGLENVIPENGVFFSGKLEYQKGLTVYDALKKICDDNNILLDSRYTPIYETYYVSGIGNLYEFDCGSESGWKYSVDGIVPGVGCSRYEIAKGDRIVFFYDIEI